MGRKKIKIKTLESYRKRQATYSKRGVGLLKKAKELAILCDTDVFLLMFSPNGQPTVYSGENSAIEDVIARFSDIPPEQRCKRKFESLKALQNAFRKSEYDVKMEQFLLLRYIVNDGTQIDMLDLNQAKYAEKILTEELDRMLTLKETIRNGFTPTPARGIEMVLRNDHTLTPAGGIKMVPRNGHTMTPAGGIEMILRNGYTMTPAAGIEMEGATTWLNQRKFQFK